MILTPVTRGSSPGPPEPPVNAKTRRLTRGLTTGVRSTAPLGATITQLHLDLQ